MTDETTIQERERVANANWQGLTEVMEKYGITLPLRTIDKWRPTQVTDGFIDGFYYLGELRCYATDGMLGLFVDARADDLGENPKPTLRHVSCFRWQVPIVSMVSYFDPTEGRTKVFQVIRDCGAPPPLFQMPPKVRAVEEKPKRKRTKSKRQQILDAL